MIKVRATTRDMLGDRLTPVSIYLKIRDVFPHAFLLESSDYHGKEDSISYIAFSPLAEFKLTAHERLKQLPGKPLERKPLDPTAVFNDFQDFLSSFQATQQSPSRFVRSGLFGFCAYEAIRFFENIQLKPNKPIDFDAPLLHYFFFEYVIAFDHFSNQIFITQNSVEGVDPSDNLQEIERLISSNNTPQYAFRTDGEITSSLTDAAYRADVLKAIAHCRRGDTFQMVLSRSFSVPFKGDEFLLYRALRSVNPSPYLFYFDYGSYKILGSSPEAQLQVNERKASIYPIAGTYRRTGHDAKDAAAAQALFEDEKENAEHVMLVDLARNDLSKSGKQVELETFKEIQFFSHVIHLVSKVSTQLQQDKSALHLAVDTFPAGTLSGAPKHRAMQLIDQYEKTQRGYYGGMIGLIDFHGNFNHAIIIRSFLSQNNRLHFRAGAGIVAQSNPDSEVQEVYNKIGALKAAIEKAETL